MSQESHTPNVNRILAALPREDYERLSPHLQPVELAHGQVLYRAGERIEHVYFPTGSMISLIAQMSGGSDVEVGVVGFEGMACLPVVLGVAESPHKCLVQIPDGAMRLDARALRDEFGRGGALHDLLLRYTQSVIVQISQAAACNRLHNVAERLARWLLMSHDRCPSGELPFTQEFLSIMLGTRRAGVTEAAIILQADGYIHYTRGLITIIDRAGLEDFSCECYPIIKAEFDRLI